MAETRMQTLANAMNRSYWDLVIHLQGMQFSDEITGKDLYRYVKLMERSFNQLKKIPGFEVTKDAY